MSNTLKERIIIAYVTCLGAGFLPKSPGTFGTAAAFLLLPLVFWSNNRKDIDVSLFPFNNTAQVYWGWPLSFYLWLAIIGFMFLIGCLASSFYMKSRRPLIHDPKEIVIDEFVAQLLLIILVTYKIYLNDTLVTYVMSFIIFRFFDIVKPGPIGLIDKGVKGGYGVMVDDLVAAIFTFLVLIFLSFVKII